VRNAAPSQEAPELNSSGKGIMSFTPVGSVSNAAVASACGDNIVIFPSDGTITRESRIARAVLMAEKSRDALMATCGVTGATRVFILLLEELIEEHGESIIESNNLSKKIARMSRVFVETAAGAHRMDGLSSVQPQD
jgi:hypothetical protein